MSAPTCELCATTGGTPVWGDRGCRVVRVEDPHYPGFCRVIWHTHVAEMSDLGPEDRAHLLRVVLAVESALRELLQPDKINLASFGNVVPHLHWHVIPRFRDDRHFPQPIWGVPQREGRTRDAPPVIALQGILTRVLGPGLDNGLPSTEEGQAHR